MSEEQRVREARLVLAASRGVFAALTRNEPLGVAAARYNYAARTLEGDAFETAFNWARDGGA